jgi:uncharacterized protein with HEPN domain
MKKNDSFFLQHILDAAERIQRHIHCTDQQAFLVNELIQDAVLRQLEIIGEAVKHLSAALRNNNPDIPWKSIAGTRDELIHHYFGLNMDIIWQAVQNDIPILKSKVAALLREFGT